MSRRKLRGIEDTPLTLVGHPYAPIGMGEQLRSHLAAAHAVRLPARVHDVFRHAGRDDDGYRALLDEHEAPTLPGGIRVFHINGDEVAPTLDKLGRAVQGGYNVVVPAWELPTYPAEWATQLRRFDEVWALSRYIQKSLAASGIASHLVGQSVEQPPGMRLPRRALGIRESAYVLLHFFDLTSYASRKNPEAVLALFDRLCAAAPWRDMQLVLKVKNGERPAEDWAAALTPHARIRLIAEPLDSLATRSLIAACDCFVSMHRAEGFGRGLGEAMALGRLALGTAHSGNLDFMTPDNSLLVPHRLTSVGPKYPHGTGQRWAEPDMAAAAALLTPILDDPARGRAIAASGQADILRSHGHRAVGLRMLDQIERIVATLQPGPLAGALHPQHSARTRS